MNGAAMKKPAKPNAIITKQSLFGLPKPSIGFAPRFKRTSKPLPNDACILTIENAPDAIAERAMT
jgi:hypothetical protein